MIKVLFITTPSAAAQILVERVLEEAKKDSMELSIEIASEEEGFERLAPEDFDLLLLCPTLRFLLNRPEKMEAFKEIPMAVVDSINYGALDGRALLKLINFTL